MNKLDETVQNVILTGWVWLRQGEEPLATPSVSVPSPPKKRFDPLWFVRDRIAAIAIEDPKFAQLICNLIPDSCPFARDIKFGDRTLFSIPPMCKLNPLYEDLMMLRFRALCYLAEVENAID